ncbi:MAG: diguanylate cyclase, partial [Pyrinomonadaceae bacterium]
MKIFDPKFLRKSAVCTALILFVLMFGGFAGSQIFGFSMVFVFAGITLMIIPSFAIGYLGYKKFVDRLEEKTAEITEVSRMHLATVEALATAIDARDQIGVGHVRRTQIYAVGIGEILQLPDSEIQALRTGALLHDIGKLGVPDHILNKPGKLTTAELEKVKIHADIGASILKKVNFPYPVIPTIKHHHEMWDGRGYPKGLRGEQIPLTARILAVADTYDTLRGARPFRPAVSREEARKILAAGAGKQFDPNIVRLFLSNLGDFEKLVVTEGLAYSVVDSAKLTHITGEERGEISYVQQIKNANREVFTLYELARVFGSAVHLEETFSLFTNKIAELVPYDTCIIYLSDELRDEAVAAFTAGANKRELQGWKVRYGIGVTGIVLKKRKPIRHTAPSSDFSGHNGQFTGDYTAMISLPLIVEEKLLGAVSLYSTEIENYGEEHMRLLETVSLMASDAINKSLKHAETETRAMTDPMTGLPNARSLQIHFEKESARAKRKANSFHLLMLDLDGFKAVNDTFGHKAGDKMLNEIARVIGGQLREYDFLARYAGDEFVAIIPETDEFDIRELCIRIEDSIKNFNLPIGKNLSTQVGVSIGTAIFPKDGESLDQIIIAADKAMYSVKDIHKRKLNVKSVRIPEVRNVTTEDSLKILPAKYISHEDFVVEVDESHIISNAIN